MLTLCYLASTRLFALQMSKIFRLSPINTIDDSIIFSMQQKHFSPQNVWIIQRAS